MEKHERFWLWIGGAFMTVAVGALAISGGFETARPNYSFWSSPASIIAYCLALAGLICFVAALRQWPFPFAHREPLNPPPRAVLETSFTIGDDPPVVEIPREQPVRLVLRVGVLNRGPDDIDSAVVNFVAPKEVTDLYHCDMHGNPLPDGTVDMTAAEPYWSGHWVYAADVWQLQHFGIELPGSGTYGVRHKIIAKKYLGTTHIACADIRVVVVPPTPEVAA